MVRLRSLMLILLVAGWSTAIWSNDANTGGHVGLVRTLSANTLGKTGFHTGGTFKFGTDMDYVAGPNGKGSVLEITGSGSGKPVADRNSPYLFTGDIFIAYGLLSFLDASIDFPLYFDITGWGEDMAGAGDLQLGLKMRYPFQDEKAFISHAYYLKLIFPTGSLNRGFFPRHSYYLKENDGLNTFTTDAFFVNPMMVWTFDFKKLSEQVPLSLHVNFGGVIAQSKSSSIVMAAIGLEYMPVPVTTFFVELTGESRVKYYSEYMDAGAINNDPFWISSGIRFNLPFGFYATLVGDLGLSDSDADLRANWNREGFAYATKATPRYGAQLTFGWNGILKEGDKDADGIIDKKDKCPDEAEDKDGFQDIDGCPDNDNDGDGIIDSQDRCPDSAGTDNGCPVYDSDSDGILNNVDKCPDKAEDPDGFEDDDGCPDPDNDGDGVVDEKDSCPAKAEDTDGFEDGDGCPDLDNDGDGVLDAEDKCPGVRGLPDNNGCPKTKEIKRGKLVLSGVTFQPGKAVLTANSYTILDQVYESLAEWSEVKLEIQGHTDNLGSNMANLKLSQRRADAVKMYLVQKGIAENRLKSVGYGEEFPIADNHTAIGREKNRRVELRRID